MRRVKERLAAWHRSRKEAALWDRHRRLQRESEKVVQAREFCGEVYLCVNDEPILPVDGLSWELPTALQVGRDAWVRWNEREASYGRHR